MIIETPAVDAARGHVAELYAEDIADDGFVMQHTRAMAVNVEAHEAFEALIGAIVPGLGVRLYELVTLAAARAIGSEHCLLAHGRKSVRAGIVDDAQLIRLAVDYRDAGLSAAEVAAMEYAERMSTDAGSMTDADSRALRDHGYTDRQIVDITLAAAARNYFSRALQALAVPVDEIEGLDAASTAALHAAARR